MEDYAISVRGLTKRYALGQKNPNHGMKGMLRSMRDLLGQPPVEDESTIWALKDVSFEVKKGERLGFVGKNGAGKSTLLKILSRVAYPTSGEARIRGRVTSLLEVGTGFLNHLTGRQNIYLNASFHGLSKKEIDARISDIVEFSELERFIDTPIKHYSSGMRARLAFSVAAHLDPDILLLDEVLSVGDMAFAQKCLQRVDELTQSDRTILFVSHSMEAVRRFCTRCIWLDCGHVVMDGNSKEVTDAFTSDSMNLSAHRHWEAAPIAKKIEMEPLALESIASKSPEPPYASLVSASLLTPDGRRTATVSVNDDICFELIYDITENDVYVLPDFKISTSENILAFNLVHGGALRVPEIEKRKAGRYRSIARLPSHLLNVGLYKVSVSLTTPTSGKLISHVVADHVLTFYVHEAPLGTISALGPYRRVKGVVRPLVDWEDEPVAE
jgi:lipopolysaccharide transport system ATP-binding protein